MAIVLDGSNGITTNSGTVISASTIGVGGATPSTSGAGITFPATQSASSDANTLDDYEEGTWTPTYTSGAGSFTSITYVGSRPAFYTKVGRVVTVQFYIGTDAITVGTATGTVTISGLPFASITSSAANFASGASSEKWGSNNPSIVQVASGQTYLFIMYRTSANGTTSYCQVSDLSTSSDKNYVTATFSYIV